MINSKIEFKEKEKNIIFDVWLNSENNKKIIITMKTIYIIIGIIMLLGGLSKPKINNTNIGTALMIQGVFFIYWALTYKKYYKEKHYKQYRKNKQYNEIIGSEREYEFTNEGIYITSVLGKGINYWNTFYSYGKIDDYIYIKRKDEHIILVDKKTLSSGEINDLLMLLSENIK